MDEASASFGIGADGLRARLAEVRTRIAEVGDPEAVTIVAVTKAFGADAALSARAAGLVDIGENYASELIEKAVVLAASPGGPVRWHLIGGIQRRSLRRLAPYVAVYESVDRQEEVDALVRSAPGAAVLIEVETTEIPGRGGVPPGEVGPLADYARAAGFDVQGLMTVAAADDDAAARRSFGAVHRLADALGLRVCSMGMSDDFVIAVEEGSTMVRLGRVLFGPRSTRRAVSQ